MNILKKLLIDRRNYKVYFFLFTVFIIIIYFIYNQRQSILIQESPLFSIGTKEVILSDNTYYSYSISDNVHRIDKENFVDYSIINYPIIKLYGKDENVEIEKTINQLLSKMVMLHYQEDLEQRVNAVYTCDYLITHADEEILCIYFTATIGEGMGRPITYSDALTISLKTGKRISLDEFGDINIMLKNINNYSGLIYSDSSLPDKNMWMENKEQLIEKWKNDEDSKYFGYYIFDGRIGLLFDFYYTGNERIALEFEGVI